MANCITLTVQDAALVAEQAAPLLKHLRRRADVQEYELLETFRLELVEGLRDDISLSSQVQETQILHHQIVHRQSRHYLFARTDRGDEGALRLLGLYESKMAAVIHRLIDDIDADLLSDAVSVSLVTFAAHHTTALWATSAEHSSLYVAASPRASRLAISGVYTEQQLLRRLVDLAPARS